MAENISSPVFASRYRLQPVPDDWDSGRSGYTVRVIDEQAKGRSGVIKRAESKSPQAIEGLKNEADALRKLKGNGVPELYDTGQAEHGSKRYEFLVMEYIDGWRVEKNLQVLSATTRAEIITQFLGVLAQAHQAGIVNGDVDLKHLFWRTIEHDGKQTKQLIVIDWGNAKLGVDSNNKAEFAYDLARSAEIIYALVTKSGHLPVTGSLKLPNETELIPNLCPLPSQFQRLCEWAPRTPTNGMEAPYTAAQLFDISKRWSTAIQNQKRYEPPPLPTPPAPRRARWLWVLILFVLLVSGGYLAYRAIPLFAAEPTIPTFTKTAPSASSTPTQVIATASRTSHPTETPTPVMTLTPVPEFTSTPAVIPTPLTYKESEPVLLLNRTATQDSCWVPDPDSQSEGFIRRDFDKRWEFDTQKNRPIEQRLQVDFQPCLDDQEVGAVALSAWVLRIEPNREFGLFVEGEDGQRREYTLWLETVKGVDKLHIRLREGAEIKSDQELLLINHLQSENVYPRRYYQFYVQIFLERNNNGFDILYLTEGKGQQDVAATAMDPKNMRRIDEVILSTVNNVQKIGLVSYGGEMQIVISPLVLFGK